MSTWLFPPFAEPVFRQQGQPQWHLGTRITQLPRIPSFDSPDYTRLLELRSEIQASIVRAFGEIRLWMIGIEPELPFFPCSDRPLTPSDYARFFADVLKLGYEAVKRENPEAVVIAHFLGRSDIRLGLGASVVQPSELMALLEDEIRRRGEPRSLFFDEWVTSIDPELALDREEETPSMVGFGGQVASSGRWVVKWLDEFTTNTSDLVATYPDWEHIGTDTSRVELTRTEVAGGLAKLRLDQPPQEPQEKEWTVGGARTTEVDVTPDEEFADPGIPTQSGNERNKWTAVLDFFPVPPGLVPPGAHVPGFLRVIPRQHKDEFGAFKDNQTRFGSFAFGGPVNAQNEVCVGGPNDVKPLGALQLTGDSISDPDFGKTALRCFEIPYNIFDPAAAGDLYRVQIVERELWSSIEGWKRRWMAEIWNLSQSAKLGGTGWVHEWTVSITYGIAIPDPLGGSKYMMAVGPGKDESGVDAERAGTAYWVY